jgi:hypothetical protein
MATKPESIRVRAAHLQALAELCRGAPARGTALAALAWVSLWCELAAATAPHPAVARIIVPEKSATSYGTGTLIDVREQYGLVVTNWHVVRDASGPPEVVFPNGFRSAARPLKLDSNWDLAALVIWRPPIEPVAISRHAPRPGDRLTICGYGQGEYRAAAGKCTQYYAPRIDFPHELLELDVEARQGDSGGPILNAQGELAGVLFGAGRGTTMGSEGGRVHSFLASLAPDIGQPAQLAVIPRPRIDQDPQWNMAASSTPQPRDKPASLLPPQALADAGQADVAVRQELEHDWGPGDLAAAEGWASPLQIAAGERASPIAGSPIAAVTSASSSVATAAADDSPLALVPSSPRAAESFAPGNVGRRSLFAQLTSLLAIIGAIALVLQLAKLATR